MKKNLLVIFLFSFFTTSAQIKKIGKIDLIKLNKNGIIEKDDFLEELKVQDNYIYLAARGKIIKFDIKGLVVGIFSTKDANNKKASTHEFVVQQNKNKELAIIYSIESENQINTIQNGKFIKSLTLNKIFKNQFDTIKYDFYNFTVDSHKNIFILHSGDYNPNDFFSNHDDYLTKVNQYDSIITFKLPPKSYQTNFKIYDSLAIFLTIPNGESSVFITNWRDTSFQRILHIHKFLGLDTANVVLKTRLVSVDEKRCLIIVSRYRSNIDYILELDIANFKLRKILQIGNTVAINSYKKDKRKYKVYEGMFHENHEFPTKRVFAFESKKLYVLTQFGTEKIIDIFEYK